MVLWIDIPNILKTYTSWIRLIVHTKLAWADFGNRHFGKETLRHMNFSAQGHFGSWIFWHGDTSVQANFSTWIFRQNGRFGTDTKISLPKHTYCFAWCWSFPVSKCPSAEIFLCRNVPVLSCPHAKMTLYQNVYGDRMSMCQNFDLK